MRFGYYFAFLLSEGTPPRESIFSNSRSGGNIACGLGYNGKDEKGNYKWDRVCSVDVIGVEMTESPKDLPNVRSSSLHYASAHIVFSSIGIRLQVIG